MVAKHYILGLARRPITAYGPDWKLTCVLCEMVPTLENGLARREGLGEGRMGMSLTYTLRPGLRWVDGVPVTTADILFSWQVGRHPESGIANGDVYRRITGIDANDERTFVVHLDRVTFDHSALNDFHLLPLHVERPQFETGEAGLYRNRSAFDRDPTNAGLYNGPYRITKVEQGRLVVLERNPYWSGPQPAFPTIIVRTIEDTAALEASILAGDIHMIPGELGLPVEQAVTFVGRNDARFTVSFRPTLGYEHLVVNQGHPALADRRVRQALMHALDRDTLASQLFGGHQPVADSSVPPLDPIHSAGLPRYRYDPAAAVRLLDEAGWRLNGGIRRNAAGEPLAFEIATTAGNRSREMVAQVLQAQWRAVGIEVRLRFEPPRVFFGDTVAKRKFPHLAMFGWPSAPGAVPRIMLHSAMIPAGTGGGQNFGGYANPVMDRLIDAIEIEPEPSRRAGLWADLQRLYADDLPGLPLFFRAEAHIWPQGLTGITPTGHQTPSTVWVENWRWSR